MAVALLLVGADGAEQRCLECAGEYVGLEAEECFGALLDECADDA